MRASLEVAERAAQEIGRDIKGRMPDGWGFTLLMSTFGENGYTTYVSSIERKTALLSMREVLQRMEGMSETPGVFTDDTRRDCWCCGETGKGAPLVKMRGQLRAIILCRVCMATAGGA